MATNDQFEKSASGTLYIPPADVKCQISTKPSIRAWKASRKYKLLNEQPPYTFTYQELLEKVAEPGNRTNSYSITRSELIKQWGWAIHEDASGKIALIGCGTEKYEALLTKPSVQKKNVSRNSKGIGSNSSIPLTEAGPALSPETEEEEFPEGRELYRQHRTRERNQQLVRQAKEKRLRKRGSLECDVCGFNFFDTYGDVGEGYIECHHTKPVSELQPDEKTNLNDIALVCANCHRMLHRKRPWLPISQLKSLKAEAGKGD